MNSFPHVEDYLEVISGHRDPTTGKTNPSWLYQFNPIISLARYDIRVLESMNLTVAHAQPLTERQGQLLCKIVLNYSRQLAAKDVDVSPVQDPKWRIPLRKMDYTRLLSIDNDTLIVKFPFSNEIIESIKSFARESQGSAHWDRDRRVWAVGLTEYNLSWLYAWATVNQFEIDPAVQELMSKITKMEQSNYSIELGLDNDKLNISNAHSNLIEYINNNIGGFGLDNILRLVDNSSILGYTISSDISQALIKEYGPRFYNLLSNREIKINPGALFTSNDFDSVLEYADSIQRWPVVIYEPDLSGRMLTKLQDRYGTDYDKTIYRHTVKPVRDLDKIPLVISSAGMVFGGDKQLMIQRAEKVVYCAQDVYNKRNNSKVKKL